MKLLDLYITCWWGLSFFPWFSCYT